MTKYRHKKSPLEYSSGLECYIIGLVKTVFLSIDPEEVPWRVKGC